MVSSCVVYGCTQRFSKDSKILFHRFPTKNPSLCRKWLRAIHREDLNEGNLKYARICSLHFNNDAYLVNASNKFKLKSEVIPKSPKEQPPKTTASGRPKRNSRVPAPQEIIEDESPADDNSCKEGSESEHNSSEDDASDATEIEGGSENEDIAESENSDGEDKGAHFQVKEYRSLVPAQFTTSSGAGGTCYVLVWNPETSTVTSVPTAVPAAPLEKASMPSDMSGMENRVKELESQIQHLVDSNTRLNQQVDLLSESNKDLKKKLKTLQQNKRRLLKRLCTMEGMVNDWKDDRKPFSFCSDDI